ncbi:unnamed protein product [Leptidea sinapis]|uniref:Uncharacterized protein n=1 Tax=Leptidea sinapis TaxID=189913 RepID=A0A5E4QI24_9NEOP|nr:unnamed protein product [Leptidea sinapis]
MRKGMKRNGEEVKENVLEVGVVDVRWVVMAAVCTAATLLVAGSVDLAFPTPLDRSAPPDKFIAEIAYEHLVNLTSIGPRVHTYLLLQYHYNSTQSRCIHAGREMENSICLYNDIFSG